MPEESTTIRTTHRRGWVVWALWVWLGAGLAGGGWEWWWHRVPENLPLDPVAWHSGDRSWSAPLWPMPATLHTGAEVKEVEADAAFDLGPGARLDWGRFAAEDDRITLSFRAWLKPAADPPEFFETYLASWMGHNDRGVLQLRPDGLRWELQHAEEDRWVLSHGFECGKLPFGRWCSVTVRVGDNSWDVFIDGIVVGKEVNWYSPSPRGAVIRFMGNIGAEGISFSNGESLESMLEVTQRASQVGENKQWGLKTMLDDLVLFHRKLSDAEIRALGTIGRGKACDVYARRQAPGRAWPIGLYLGVGGCLLALIGSGAIGRAVELLLMSPDYRSVRVAVIIGGGITTALVAYLHRESMRSDVARFREMHGIFQQLLDTQFEKIAGEVRRVADWVRFQTRMDPADWEQWVAASSMLHEHTALLGVGYALQVPLDQQEAHDRDWSARWGFPYSVWPKVPPARSAGTATRFVGEPRLPVVLYACQDPTAARWKTNGTILGRDLLWADPSWQRVIPEPIRIEDAVSDPGMTASGREQIAPASWFDVPVYGLRLYQPHRLIPGERVELIRADTWRGVAFASVDLRRWLLKDFQEMNLPLGCRVYTGTSTGDRHDLLLDTSEMLPGSGRPQRPRLETTLEIKLYGSRLWIDCWTTKAFERQSRAHWPWVAGWAGGGFTMLAALALGFQVRARLRERSYAQQLAGANAALAKAQLERERLSRDLHDGSIQSLYAVGLHLRSARRQVPGTERELGTGLAECQRLVQASIIELRDFLLQLREESGPTRTYREVMDEWVRRLRRISEEEIELVTGPESDGLPTAVVVELVQISREAVSNAMRHGGAERITVTLRQEEKAGRNWILEIEDDGKGWVSEPTPGVGFRSMRDRARELGGRFELHGRALEGTRVRVTFSVGADE